eukprot:4183875-Pleurochrysis_carterae.AAC.1
MSSGARFAALSTACTYLREAKRQEARQDRKRVETAEETATAPIGSRESEDQSMQIEISETEMRIPASG